VKSFQCWRRGRGFTGPVAAGIPAASKPVSGTVPAVKLAMSGVKPLPWRLIVYLLQNHP